jgi:hypothetical protein
LSLEKPQISPKSTRRRAETSVSLSAAEGDPSADEVWVTWIKLANESPGGSVKEQLGKPEAGAR